MKGNLTKKEKHAIRAREMRDFLDGPKGFILRSALRELLDPEDKVEKIDSDVGSLPFGFDTLYHPATVDSLMKRGLLETCTHKGKPGFRLAGIEEFLTKGGKIVYGNDGS